MMRDIESVRARHSGEPALTTMATTPDKPKKRIFVVDDHPLVREMLSDLVNHQPDLVVCGEAESAPQALERIVACKPDLAIIDITLRDSSGLRLIKDLSAIHPKLAILVFSMHDEFLYAERAVRSGARGYVMKQAATRKVIEGVHRVLEGKIYISKEFADAKILQLAEADSGKKQTPVELLGDRELEIFELLGQGQSSVAIARILGISVRTVHYYYRRMKEQLKLESGQELIREAMRWHATQRGAN